VPSRATRTLALLPALGWSKRDLLAALAAGCAVVAILVNALWLQKGPHPAPMFKPKLVAEKPAPPVEAPRPRAAEVVAAPAPALPPARPAAPVAPAKPVARLPGEIITDIQRELARRGFFDGAVDGIYGPKTDGAIREFEHAAGLKPSPEPSEALLQAIVRAPARIARTTGSTVARPPAPVAPVAPARHEPDRPPPNKRVLAVQRVLAEYGYGQIRPTGLLDAETQAAIEKFERERRLPVTGQPSERTVRELAAVTGRTLD
jgi:peptidoglycan hydrolase-like protein with peptidoglycan-binding domain